MEERLMWAFELVDRVTKPSTKVEAALKDLSKTLSLTGDQSKGLSSSFSFLTRGSAGLGAGLGVVGGVLGAVTTALVAGVVAVGAFTGAVAYAGFEFGKFAIDALAFKESTLASFELMLGTKEKANEIFNEALTLGKLTPFQTEDVLKSYKQILSAGFKREEAPIVFQGLGDIAAASNFDANVIPGVLTQLAQVKGKGKLQFDDLKQIANYTSLAGVGMDKVYEKIGKLKGITPQLARTMVSAGQITADDGIYAIFDAISARAGGAVGNVMMVQSKTMLGLFSNLQSAASDFLYSMKLTDLTGLDSFKGALTGLIDTLSTASPAGQRLQKVLQTILNDGLNALFGGVDSKSLTSAFDKLVTGIEKGWKIVKAFAAAGAGFFKAIKPGVMELGKAIAEIFGGGDIKSFSETLMIIGVGAGKVFGGIATGIAYVIRAFTGFQAMMGLGRAIIVGELTKIWAFIVAIGDALATAFKPLIELFKNIGGMISSGLKMGLTGFSSIGATIATPVVDSTKAELGIHSPSTVFAEIGRDTMRGFALGVEGESSLASAATGVALEPPQVRSGLLGGGGQQTITITVPITMNVDQNVDAQAIARQLSEMLPAELTTAFNRMAEEQAA